MGDEDEDACFDSGPFCRHWGSLGDCDELCVCGHRCDQHDGTGGDGDDNGCRIDGCACKSFTEPPGLTP